MVGLLQYLFPALVVAVAAQSTLAQSGPLAFPAGLKHNTQQKGENIHMLSQRHLQQAGAPAEAAEPAMVTSVSTAEELQTAVRTGRSYIEIVEHLTLDSLTLINSSDINLGPKLLGTIPSTVKSIRGNCAAAAPDSATLGLSPTHTPLRPLTPGQCIIVANHGIFNVKDTSMWLDSLYIRLSTPRDDTFFEFFYARGDGPIVDGASAALFMTNVTLQGNGDDVADCQDCAVALDFNAALYAEDCLFADFDGSRTTGVYSGATANFVSCEFTNNTLFSDQGDSSVIEADGYDEYDYENDGDSLVRLQGCTFSGNTPETTPVLLADDAGDNSASALFYSDTEVTMCTKGGENSTASDAEAEEPCIDSMPEALSVAADFFLDLTDSWFIATQKALNGGTQPQDSAAAPEEATTGDADSPASSSDPGTQPSDSSATTDRESAAGIPPPSNSAVRTIVTVWVTIVISTTVSVVMLSLSGALL